MHSDSRFSHGAVVIVLLSSVLTGCGGYADFTLPPLEPASHPRTMSLQLAPQPVIERGSAHDVLNPSVVRVGGQLYNFYSEFDGRVWRTALAASGDGVHWDLHGVVLSPNAESWEGSYIAANGSAFYDGATWWYWYQAGPEGAPQIGLARSGDGRSWRKEPKPVLGFGPRGSWDERGVADPYVIRIGSVYYLYYLGQNRARQQQIGLARSSDGVHWTKLRSSPVLTIPEAGSGAPDENGLGEPAVWQAQGSYWMLYTGRSATERRSLIAAQSRDGVHWTRQPKPFTGDQPWDRAVLCDPTVLDDRLWFGGGDQPNPAQNLDGQIGVGSIAIQ
ncbi:family 43 glycosylhydrolase [Nevskia soli]|uniref:family 43 glycosylhydrolase n=1 Tax=Nevskia soli TaxID=418856 RepID=UPI0015D7D7ED|nr:family 43 glycosylhydrolase [Nevskia soli]